MESKLIQKDEGVILCAVGSRPYYYRCNTLIRDIKSQMPGIPIAVYTDSPKDIVGADIFLNGKHNPDLVFLSKIIACQNSPFYKSIFIDVDCRLLKTVSHLFDILQKHDIGLTFANSRKLFKKDDWMPNSTGIPLCTSTMVFKKSDKVSNLFFEWEKHYVAQEIFPGRSDQVYFQYLLYNDTNIRYFLLPDEYHFNTDHPTFVAGSIKILTSAVSDYDAKGKYSLEKLNAIFNPEGIFERLAYVKILGSSPWKKIVRFLPPRIIVVTISKSKERKIMLVLKGLIKKLFRNID